MTEYVRCAICDNEVPISDARECFTGRLRYVCFQCDKVGRREIKARDKKFFDSASGQKLLERRRKER